MSSPSTLRIASTVTCSACAAIVRRPKVAIFPVICTSALMPMMAAPRPLLPRLPERPSPQAGLSVCRQRPGSPSSVRPPAGPLASRGQRAGRYRTWPTYRGKRGSPRPTDCRVRSPQTSSRYALPVPWSALGGVSRTRSGPFRDPNVRFQFAKLSFTLWSIRRSVLPLILHAPDVMAAGKRNANPCTAAQARRAPHTTGSRPRPLRP